MTAWSAGGNADIGDEYTVGYEDGLSPGLACVRDAISHELYAQLPLRNQVIEQADIPGVAYAVTVMLDRLRLLDDGRQHDYLESLRQ